MLQVDLNGFPSERSESKTMDNVKSRDKLLRDSREERRALSGRSQLQASRGFGSVVNLALYGKAWLPCVFDDDKQNTEMHKTGTVCDGGENK